MIHICFALYDAAGNYCKFTGTAMLSILENYPGVRCKKSIIFHILHDNTLTRDNRDKLNYISGQYDQEVKFYNVNELCPEKVTTIKNVLNENFNNRFSVAAMYRFLIPYLLLAYTEKAIYLDSDIIVNLDINRLWRIKLDDKALGAIPNIFQRKDKSAIIEHVKKVITICGDNVIDVGDYFNSGVLLMNLKVMLEKENDIMSAIKFIGEHPRYLNFDQDVLNYCFSKNYLRLSADFNQLIKYARPEDKSIRRKIYHYAGAQEGLGFDTDDPFNRLWFDYFSKTPWFEGSIISNVFKRIKNIGQERKNSLIKFSAALSGKKRVFVVKDKKNINWLKKTYSIRDDEEIFVIEDEESLPQLIEEMKTSRDKKLFLIRAWELIRPLKEAGFVEEKDFFNHCAFFSSNLFSKKDVYSLLKVI